MARGTRSVLRRSVFAGITSPREVEVPIRLSAAGRKLPVLTTMSVLVLDGQLRSSLAIVRSLGRAGVDVQVGEHYRNSLSTYSKYCSEQVRYRDPNEHRGQFIDDLAEIVGRNDYEMVLSAGETTTYPLSYNKQELSDTTVIPLPGWETMEHVVDKKRTFALADDIGVPMPVTHTPTDESEAKALDGRIEYPVVVKPRSKTTWIDEKPVVVKVTAENYVNDRSELLEVFGDIDEKTGIPPLVQEYIPGEGCGVELLRYDDEIVTQFMHKRLREYPISGGASTFRKSIYNEALMEPATALLDELDWEGVAMVEFRLDERDNRPKLMEINGRFWGSLPLAVAAGANFPYDLYSVYNGGNIDGSGYETDVYSRWLFPGDFLWLFDSIQQGSKRLPVLYEFLTSFRSNYDIASREDPYPLLGVGAKLFRQLKLVSTGSKNIKGETR